MYQPAVAFLRPIVPLAALLLLAQCSGDTDPAPAADAGSAGGDAPSAAVAPAAAEAAVPEACGFIPRAELEQTVGWELREGEPQDMPAGRYACDFEMPPQLYVTRTFPNPPLPQSVGFSSVTLTTFPADPTRFAQNRELIGPQGEEPAGIGDAAFYNGLDMLYVRVGNRGFSVRLYTNAQAAADRAHVREVMLTLGRKGADRLK